MSKVSIIIPIYNVEKYLEECLKSVINQTFSDIEIICVDDKSTDCSVDILQQYAKLDNRIIILQNQENKGLAYTRNVGMDYAKGEYILFIDSDDYIEEDLLETVLKNADGHDVLCFDYIKKDEIYSGFDSHLYTIRDGSYRGEDYFIYVVSKNEVIYSAWSKLYRRDFLKTQNIRFFDGILYEDILFCFMCLTKADRIYSMAKKLYNYRYRINSIMTKKISEKNVKDYFFSLCKLTELYISNNFERDICDSIEKYIQNVGRDYIKHGRKYFYQNDNVLPICDNMAYDKVHRIFSKLVVDIDDRIRFSDNQWDLIMNSKYILVYGAGDIARDVIEIFDRKDIEIYGIAVGDSGNNRKSLMGNKIRELEYYHDIREECLVIIATTSRYYVEVRTTLEKYKFKNYIEVF